MNVMLFEVTLYGLPSYEHDGHLNFWQWNGTNERKTYNRGD